MTKNDNVQDAKENRRGYTGFGGNHSVRVGTHNYVRNAL